MKRKVEIKKDRLKALKKEKGTTFKKMCDDIGLPYETFLYCYKKGEIMPDYLEAIARYYDEDYYYLTGDMEKRGSFRGRIKSKHEEELKKAYTLFREWIQYAKFQIRSQTIIESDDNSTTTIHYPFEEYEKDYYDIVNVCYPGDEEYIESFESYLMRICLDSIENDLLHFKEKKRQFDELKQEGKYAEFLRLKEELFR